MVKFSKKEREEFNKSWKEVLDNPIENINKKDTKGRTILHYAVGMLDPKKVRLLIKKGADINVADAGQYRPLHLAVMGQRLENTKELIKAEVDVNAVERSSKFAPLHLACMVSEIKIVEELVKAGANIEQKDKFGKTPMDYARNNKEIIEVLENVKMANKQREFIERGLYPAAGVIVAKEELETVDEEVL
ncbi:ankyrin repeat domain-containing protein [Wolbachia endosymbiont (group A) of Lasioglossum morio]|uniref:ankyrin repeat domain-containing protein n=1 Tax=Wolbachia endosymbiont (group A) of Lasioglossum morio TaxID=2954025 RepID=UPI0022265353|nr:ankyrin repeat domain-containing protein [Wolbachia endosymbiont (group A) of Lasioglossum morio]